MENPEQIVYHGVLVVLSKDMIFYSSIKHFIKLNARKQDSRSCRKIVSEIDLEVLLVKVPNIKKFSRKKTTTTSKKNTTFIIIHC